jgi:hypothetical protein
MGGGRRDTLTLINSIGTSIVALASELLSASMFESDDGNPAHAASVKNEKTIAPERRNLCNNRSMLSGIRLSY